MPQDSISPSFRDSKRLDRKAAAEYLGVAPQTLTKWAYEGFPHVPYYRLGRKAVYDTQDLDAFLAKRRQGGAVDD